MFHKVTSVSAMDNYILIVRFAEGITKKYDVSGLFNRIVQFQILQNSPELYYSVEVDTGGYGIVWNDDLDLSCDELWEHGEVIHTAFDDLISFGDATTLWGLNESTLRKAVAYGKLRNGIDVQKFGKQWIISKDSMIREYGQPRE